MVHHAGMGPVFQVGPAMSRKGARGRAHHKGTKDTEETQRKTEGVSTDAEPGGKLTGAQSPEGDPPAERAVYSERETEFREVRSQTEFGHEVKEVPSLLPSFVFPLCFLCLCGDAFPSSFIQLLSHPRGQRL